jgi:hypothetical protein
MQTCCCDLAGTEACKHCSANGAQEKVLIWTNNDLTDYKDFTDYKSSKDTWEIPSFMLKENSNES